MKTRALAKVPAYQEPGEIVPALASTLGRCERQTALCAACKSMQASCRHPHTTRRPVLSPPCSACARLGRALPDPSASLARAVALKISGLSGGVMALVCLCSAPQHRPAEGVTRVARGAVHLNDTMRLEFSGPLTSIRLGFSIQAL